MIAGTSASTITDQDLRHTALTAIASASAAIDAVAAAAHTSAGHTDALAALQGYDDAYADLSNAAGLSSVVAKCHPRSQTRAKAAQLYGQLTAAIASHTSHAEIPTLAKAIDLTLCDGETEELVLQLRINTARTPISSDTAATKNLRAIIEDLKRDFDANIRDDVHETAFEGACLTGLPAGIAATLTFDTNGKTIVKANQTQLSAIARHAHNRSIRERAWRAMRKRAFPANTAVLADLLAARHQLANLYGFDDWASLSLSGTMFGKPEQVQRFLAGVVEASTLAVDAQVHHLQAHLQRIEPTATLMPWDVEYLVEQIKRDSPSIGADHREYFEATGVIERALHLVADLFGFTTYRSDQPSWHTDVRSFTVVAPTPNGGDVEKIGEIHIDAFQRPGKTAGSRTLVIRRGKRHHSVTSCALLFSFPTSATAPTLLDHIDVTSILHELGHAVHLIFSGRRTWASTTTSPRAREFVEVPPQILESLSRDPRVLATLSRHYRTAERLPDTEAVTLVNSAGLADALNLRTQVLYAALSLRLHQGNPANIDFARLVNELFAAITGFFPSLNDVHLHLSFRHLGPYSALCYGYVWSQTIAQQLYHDLTSADDIRGAAALLRDHVLVDTRAPLAAVDAFRSALAHRELLSDRNDLTSD